MMKGSVISSSKAATIDEYAGTRDICIGPSCLTFASLNRVRFFRDFNIEVYTEETPYLEKEAQSTISKLKTSLLYRKGIIQTIIADINKSEQIIYFDISIDSSITQTCSLEFLGYLNDLFVEQG